MYFPALQIHYTAVDRESWRSEHYFTIYLLRKIIFNVNTSETD